MSKPFHNKGYWAVILGGSSGLGWASAQRLAAQGMHLCLIFRERKSRLRTLAPEWERLRESGTRVVTFNKDASDEAAMREVLGELRHEMGDSGSVRLLLHSIARGNLKPLAAAEDQPRLNKLDFEITLDAMALNWHRWAAEMLEGKLFAEDARLLAFTSEGSARAWPGYAAVGAAKAALEALMRSMAREFAAHGLRCNVLQPGVTDTPSLRMIPGSREMITGVLQRNPYGRLTTPEDVAQVVDLLCRDEAAWINGAVIPVDGGESISG